MVEARIDQTATFAFRRLAAPGRIVEEITPFLGRAEHESRGQEYRRLDGALREQRVVAVAEHQRLWVQQMIRQAELVVAVNFHRRPPEKDVAWVRAVPSRVCDIHS